MAAVIAINKSWRCDDDGDGDDMGGLPPAPPRQPLPSFALFCLLQLHLARSICSTQASVRIADGGLNARRGWWGLCKPARVERGPPTAQPITWSHSDWATARMLHAALMRGTTRMGWVALID